MNQLISQNSPDADAENVMPLRTRRPVLALTGFFFALVACGLAGWTFFLTQQRASATQETVTALQAHYATIEQSAQDMQRNAAQRESTLATTLQDLEARVAETENVLGFRATDWLWAEAEYFLSLAQEQLILNRDVGTAIAALELADARLQRANLPETLGVRAEIAKSLATLQAFQRPDVAGHTLKLSALIARADQLPLAHAEVVGTADTATPEETPANMFAAMWASFKSLIVVRHSNQALPALLAPEQSLLLRLNLQIQLESTRLSMLRREPDNFAASIRAARDGLARYFDRSSPEVLAAITQLDELAQVNIAWRTPDISAPLQVMHSLRAQTGPRGRLRQNTPEKVLPAAAPTGVTP